MTVYVHRYLSTQVRGSLAEYRRQGNGGADGISQWENALAGTMLKHHPHFGGKDGFRGLVAKD
jgi:hypothetical protein